MTTRTLSTMRFFVRVISLAIAAKGTALAEEIEKGQRFKQKEVAASITSNEPDKLKGESAAIYVHMDGSIRILERTKGGWTEKKAGADYSTCTGTKLLVKTDKLPNDQPSHSATRPGTPKQPGNAHCVRGRNRPLMLVVTEADMASAGTLN